MTSAGGDHSASRGATNIRFFCLLFLISCQTCNPAAKGLQSPGEDKATGSDSLSEGGRLIEAARAPALHSPLLMCNGCICSIDEELSETDHRDRSPSIVVLPSINKPAGAGNLPPE